jgi:hypothetical protein
MNQLVDLITKITRILVWWTVVDPWERALRIRLGRRVTDLPPGVHLKVPFVDAVYKQSVRRRVTQLTMQTLTTRDGRSLSIAGNLIYQIDDIRKLYDGMHHAEDGVRALARGAVAAYVHAYDSPMPAAIATAAVEEMRLEQFGLGDVHVEITEFVYARTHRLLMDQTWGLHGESLDTTKANEDAA